MRKLLLLIAILLLHTRQSTAQNNTAIAPYAAFLKGQKQSAKDYILNLFETNDIVVIYERLHPEFTQYHLLADIISDKRFIDKVGNVFTEIGLSTLNPELNLFLHTRGLPADSVNKRILFFQRNSSFWPVWNNANYYYFLDKIYSLNNSLSESKAINLYPSDVPFQWAGADTAAMIGFKEMLINRDSIMAAQIITQFDKIKKSNQKRKKALVIMNYRHAFNKELKISDGRSAKNTAFYLFEKYKSRVANILLNTVKIDNDGFHLVQDGKWDAAFEAIGNKSIGFDFTGSPFGKDSFDIWPFKTDYTYQDIFTGFAFFQPVENHLNIEGVPGFIDPAFKDEVYNRIKLISLVNDEFRSKMQYLKQAIEGENPRINIREERKYYNLDALMVKRNYWLQ